MNEKANLADKLALFSDYFAPRTIGQFNGHDVMVAKLRGPFLWHKHDDTDDFFLVLRGTLDIELRDRTVTLGAGEMFVVPKGVEHRPIARDEVHLLLIEPTGTPNTGDVRTAAPRQTI
jgi:mannose-6-phosphate isomerase-like protein (cupin superfamily)